MSAFEELAIPQRSGKVLTSLQHVNKVSVAPQQVGEVLATLQWVERYWHPLINTALGIPCNRRVRY
jgi:hypothetical protein